MSETLTNLCALRRAVHTICIQSTQLIRRQAWRVWIGTGSAEKVAADGRIDFAIFQARHADE